MLRDPLPVKMCVCSGITFEKMKAMGITSFEELKEKFGVSDGCGSCEPYVRRMLRTGETAFPILPPTDPNDV